MAGQQTAEDLRFTGRAEGRAALRSRLGKPCHQLRPGEEEIVDRIIQPINPSPDRGEVFGRSRS